MKDVCNTLLLSAAFPSPTTTAWTSFSGFIILLQVSVRDHQDISDAKQEKAVLLASAPFTFKMFFRGILSLGESEAVPLVSDSFKWYRIMKLPRQICTCFILQTNGGRYIVRKHASTVVTGNSSVAFDWHSQALVEDWYDQSHCSSTLVYHHVRLLDRHLRDECSWMTVDAVQCLNQGHDSTTRGTSWANNTDLPVPATDIINRC